ncbi:hypothetical protein QQY66_06300 [Streptomyces sp. DG2A-72]|uniref:hypothetical protein n=1 Tax=Streptomyces sp. DG2A-72 TaxID=3051386 RepID=UPI00265B8B88|nr:hypothetical protein [Streptomyces sp. DG2A-72]MDO0931310.1 hypothetical protein [Streptomyces sp. DG2A-72]
MPNAQRAFEDLPRDQQIRLLSVAHRYQRGDLSQFHFVQNTAIEVGSRALASQTVLCFNFTARLRGVAKVNNKTGQFALHDVQYARAGGWETMRPRARRAVSLATWIAGPQRSHLCEEWTAILAGDPDSDVFLSSWQRLMLALGFLIAAIRMRASDLVRPLWRPVDWLLSQDSRTNGFIASIVGAQAIYIVDDGGIPALVTEVWEPCGILGAGLYVLARWLRRVRGIELAAVSAPPEE